LPGVRYLRDADDADAIRVELRTGARLAVIGGGWIGAEVAASARQMGAQVTLVERDELPLIRVLGIEPAQYFADLHRRHGVDVRVRTEVAGFGGGAGLEFVELADGDRIECDLAVVGVGVVPRTRLVGGTGLAVEDGLVVSDSMASADEAVYAVGDVARPYHPFFRGPFRLEHWAGALHQPPVAVRAMLGKPASYSRQPYFFSDQYDAGLEYTGRAAGADRLVFRGQPETGEFVAFWLRDGRLLAGLNVNVWDVADTIRSLIESQAELETERLTDPDTPLASLVPAP
jgi:3-phenylpropionate/trans-cinnamate dioxygenase ferredoxin reductase subunit